MKKLFTILLLFVFTALIFSSCTEEVVKPREGGVTIDPKSQW